MNLEEVKRALFNMIEETEHLNPEQITTIPGTKIRIKKGRVEEFLNAAKLYYQIKNDVILFKEDESTLDHIVSVYNELKQEQEEKEKAQAHNWQIENLDEFKKLEELNKSLEINTKDQARYRKAEKELKERAETDLGIWSEIRGLQDLIKSLEVEKIAIKNEITTIKDKINNRAKQIIEKQMKMIRDNYIINNKPRNHESGFDGAPILNENKEEYDNLYLLLKVIENASGELPVKNVDNLLCVNPHQEETAKILLPKINFFQLANPDMTVEKPKLLDINQELKESIALSLAKLIKKAKDHPEEERAEGKEVLKSDLGKYNLLARQFEILTLIYDTDELTKVGKAQIPIEKEEEYKEVCEKLAKFEPSKQKEVEEEKKLSFVDLSNNQKLIEKIQAQINTLIGNQALNQANLETFNLLARQIEILRNVDPTAKLKKIGDIIINEQSKDEYNDIIAKLENRKNTEEMDPLKINEPWIKETEEKINQAPADSEEQALLKQKLEILRNVKATDSLVSVDGAKISVLKLDEYIDTIEKLKDRTEEKDNSSNNQPGEEPELLEPPQIPIKRRIVKTIRESNQAEWWQKNWKKVAGVGLSIMVVGYGIATLAPAIVYATSCLAIADTSLAGALGIINNIVITASGTTVKLLSFEAAAGNLGLATLNVLTKLGLIGGGITAAYKISQQQREKRLPDPERKTMVNKIKEVGSTIFSKIRSVGTNIKGRATELLNNLSPDQVENLDDSDAIYNEARANVEKQIEAERQELEEAEKRIEERYEQIGKEDTASFSDIIQPEAQVADPLEVPVEQSVIALPEHMPVYETAKEPTTITIPSDEEIERLLSGEWDVEPSLGRGR